MFPSAAGFSGVAPSASPSFTNLSAVPFGGAGAARSLPPTLLVNGGAYQQAGMQHNQPFTQLPASQPAASQFVSAVPSGSNSQGLTSNPLAQAQPPQTVEVKSNDRKELPAQRGQTSGFHQACVCE